MGGFSAITYAMAKESGGGGGGGTDNYNLLKNLPQINGQTVKGNMSGATLGLVNMVMGKDLSTNDYTNADKAIVDSVTADLADKVDKVTGKGLSENDYTDADKAIVDGVTSALAGKADVSSVPTKTSDLTNDSGFITNLVNNLLNYYLKSETYSKTEVDAMLQAITTLDIQAVSQLPTTNISTTTIYLVPKQSLSSQDVKDEYINLDGTTAGWERIGTTEIDLSNYVTTSDLTTALANYVTSEQFSKEFFIGTQAAWNSLTVSQKTEYTFAVITDDYDDNPVGNLNALTTTDKSSCVGAINEVKGGVIASVTADGVKTYSALFDELYALVSNATILYPERLKVKLSTTIFQVTNPKYEFSKSYLDGNGRIFTIMITMKASGSLYRQSGIDTSGASSYDNLDTLVPPNNLVISVIY